MRAPCSHFDSYYTLDIDQAASTRPLLESESDYHYTRKTGQAESERFTSSSSSSSSLHRKTNGDTIAMRRRRRLVSVAIAATFTLVSVNLSFMVLPSMSLRSASLAARQNADMPFAITALQLVTGANDQQVLANCEAQDHSVTWATAGINWNTGDGSQTSTRLCAQRQSINSLTGNSSANQVLTRILVLDSVSQCPPSMKRLGTNSLVFQATLTTETQVPAIVCVQFESAADAIPRRRFISDIMVTQERNYNNMYSGWTTIPINVQIQSSEAASEANTQTRGASTHAIVSAMGKSPDTGEEGDTPAVGATTHAIVRAIDVSRRLAEGDANPFQLQGAFISYKRPVLPIVGFKVLGDVTTATIYQTCGEIKASGSTFWEQAGDGFMDAKDDSLRVLCLQRDSRIDDTSARILTEVDLATSNACKAGFEKSQQLSADAYLCGKFVAPAPTSKRMFLGDLALVRTKLNHFDERIEPGSWRGFQNDLNGRTKDTSTFLFYRGTDDVEFDPPAPLQKPPLLAKANGDGLSFKILQLADLHFTGDPNYSCRDPPKEMEPGTCVEALTSKFINALLDAEKPDMVVFTGDNVETFSPEFREIAMNTAFQAVEERQIPWAMVIGNHDDENGFDRESIFSMALAKKYSYIQHGPQQVDGAGNYELNVFAPNADASSSDGKAAVLRMYFLDSHSYPDKRVLPDTKSTYDWVKQNQIDFYRVLSRSHADERVPSLMFFHIPIPEFEMASTEALSGERNEGISSPNVDTNLFSTLVEHNEVKAVFVGHDHVNEFCTKRQGIQLCYGGGAGFGRAYGRDTFMRRARVIEWTKAASGARSIKSWKRYYDSVDQIKHMETLFQE